MLTTKYHNPNSVRKHDNSGDKQNNRVTSSLVNINIMYMVYQFQKTCYSFLFNIVTWSLRMVNQQLVDVTLPMTGGKLPYFICVPANNCYYFVPEHTLFGYSLESPY